MNLKQIASKMVASVISVYMLVSNVAITGIGLTKTIAADVKAPEVAITSEVQKYVQYEKKEGKGAIVQEKITLAEQGDENTYLPIQRVNLSIAVPAINGVLPSRVSLLSASTQATNSKQALSVNQEYNQETGLLTIAYENTEEIAYQVNAKDAFEIIYNYPETAHISNGEACELVSKVKVRVEYKAENQLLAVEKLQTFIAGVSQNVGNIVNHEYTAVSDVYKGYLYTNEQKTTNNATNYHVQTTLSVLNHDMISQIKAELQQSKFTADVMNTEKNTVEETEINKEVIQYVNTTIAENDFEKMLGRDGWVDFYVEDQKYATVHYTPADKKGNRSYYTEYYGEEPQGAEAGKVVYPASTKAVRIETSAPQTEATLALNTEKQIVATNHYGMAVKQLKNIREKNTVVATKEETIVEESKAGSITLKEPTTQMNFDISNKNLSTLSSNKTTLTVKLDDTNESCNLFKAGTMEIKLPNNLTNVKIAGTKILYANGLSVTEATIKDGKIVLTIEGEQKAYDVSNINGGVNIVIDLEDMTFDARTPSHAENITLTYAGKTTNVGVNIVSKAGVLLLNKVTTSEGASVTSIDPTEKTVALAMNKQGQTITQNVYLVNNYANELSNVALVGTIGDKDERTKGNIENKIAEAITVNGAEADVYYSTDGSNWTKEFNKNATAYKVVLKGNLKATGSVAVAVKVNVPDGLTYNQKSYFNTVATYTNEKNTLSQASLVNLVTEEEDIVAPTASTLSVARKAAVLRAPAATNSGLISATIETNATVFGNAEEVLYNEGDIVEYHIIVKNEQLEPLNNIVIEQEVPSYMEYVEGGVATKNYIPVPEEYEDIIAEDNYDGFTITEAGLVENGTFKSMISELNANEERYIVVRYKVQNIADSSANTVESKANVYVNEETYQTNAQVIHISQPKYTISIASDKAEEDTLSAGEEINYTITVRNTGSNAAEFEVKDNIPEQLEVTKLSYEVDGREIDNFETSTQDISIVNTLEPNSTLIVKIAATAREIETENAQIITVNNVAKLINGENEQTSNVVATRVQTIAAEINRAPDPAEVGEIPNDDNTTTTPTIDDNNTVEGNETTGNSTTGGNTDEPGTEENAYSISGVAWLDNNRDGKRDEGEDLLSGVTVTLINSTTGETVKNSEGNAVTTTTDESGAYTFSNVANGTYLVMFDFDTNEYTVTTYQKNGVEATQNSDAIMSNVNVDGSSKRAGVTNNIQVNGADITNIDIGLIKNAIFDLSLDKKISSITVVNAKGTKTKEYRNKNFAKVDLVAKYMNNTNVIVTYKFVITNKGEVTGYVDRLVDNLPSGLEFNSELNKDWYRGSDGNLYTGLNGVTIKPGESKEVELVLTKKTTENSTGTFSNNAELASITNIEAIEEKEAAKENNKSSADVVISIKTGSAMLYTGITLAGVAIIGAGVYLVKKKATDSEEI